MAMGENRDSTDELLQEAQSVAPQDAAVDSDRKARDLAVKAWNALCKKMVEVIKTIRKNETRQEQNVHRMAHMTLAVWIAMGLAITGAFYLAVQAEKAINNLHRQTIGAMDVMAKDQKATLTAITKLSEAVSKKLEADVAPSQQADDEAEVAALDAQKAALEATKQVTNSPAEKAKADKAIKKVEAKTDAKKNGVSKRPPPYDPEELSKDKPIEEDY